jgi:hypothetical protein
MTTSSDRFGGGAGTLHALGIDELAAEARQSSRDQFAARFPHLFLLIYEDGQDGEGKSPVAFETDVADLARRASSLGGALRVLPLVKSPGNPYADRVSVGRARNCDMVLRFPSVSKLHAHVRGDGSGGWTVSDEASQNGTRVNGAPLAPGKPVTLRSGDAITFGTIAARVVDAGELHDTLHRMIAAARG